MDSLCAMVKEPRFFWAIQLFLATSEQYLTGALITLPHIRHPIIVINTHKAAENLLARKKSFACCPYFPMIELLGRQDNVGFTYYGERLKKMRVVLHFSLNKPNISTVWADLLDNQSLSLCRDLHSASESFYSAVER